MPKKYNYYSETVAGNPDSRINELADDGWELIAAHCACGDWYLVFRKQGG